MNGSQLATSHTHSTENYSDDVAVIRRGGYEHWKTEGAPDPSGVERQDIYISLLPDELQENSQFSLGVPFALKTSVYGHSFEIASSKVGTIDTSTSFEKSEADTTLLSPALEMTLRFSLKDSVFHIDGVLDTSWEDGEDRIHLTGRLHATVTPIAAAPKSNGLIRSSVAAGGRTGSASWAEGPPSPAGCRVSPSGIACASPSMAWMGSSLPSSMTGLGAREGR